MPEWCEKLICLFFPPRCVLCQQVVCYSDILCGACGYDEAAQDEVDGKIKGSGLSGAVAVMVYDDLVSNAIVAYKSYADKRMTVFFSRKMIASVHNSWGNANFDVIVPVPMSKAARRRRGFNQAEKLAVALGGALDVPVRTDLLTRTNQSLPQHNLNREERRQNAQRSYIARDGMKLNNEAVLLVDDVITTGATASACAAQLLKAGAGGVWLVTVASTALSH